MKKNKIIVINGTTSSGKTSLAVRLAYKYNGEIISSDSRQVYKGMDIGTGKDLAEYKIKDKKGKIINIPYHLIDVVSPKTDYNLGKFKKKADKVLKDIIKRGKLPIIAGGTGLWTQALVDNFNLSPIKPDPKLREKLEKLSVSKLFVKLREIDKKFADNLHESDKKNKRRLIRYIEVKSRKLKVKNQKPKIKSQKYEYLLLGLAWTKDVLEKRIYKRLIDRIEKEGMIDEVKKLHFKKGVSWKRLIGFGLEYKYISLYLQGFLQYDEMTEKLFIAIRQFAKKQRSWYRRWEKTGAKIHWLKNYKEGDKLVKDFLK
jgi:tRNA dimethylallyltransferase